ncbi:hypothetical protein SVIOM342S_06939 [Streptomyces violaceorubidus]
MTSARLRPTPPRTAEPRPRPPPTRAAHRAARHRPRPWTAAARPPRRTQPRRPVRRRPAPAPGTPPRGVDSGVSAGRPTHWPPPLHAELDRATVRATRLAAVPSAAARRATIEVPCRSSVSSSRSSKAPPDPRGRGLRPQQMQHPGRVGHLTGAAIRSLPRCVSVSPSRGDPGLPQHERPVQCRVGGACQRQTNREVGGSQHSRRWRTWLAEHPYAAPFGPAAPPPQTTQPAMAGPSGRNRPGRPRQPPRDVRPRRSQGWDAAAEHRSGVALGLKQPRQHPVP